jgi:hypothetical protein
MLWDLSVSNQVVQAAIMIRTRVLVFTASLLDYLESSITNVGKNPALDGGAKIGNGG